TQTGGLMTTGQFSTAPADPISAFLVGNATSLRSSIPFDGVQALSDSARELSFNGNNASLSLIETSTISFTVGSISHPAVYCCVFNGASWSIRFIQLTPNVTVNLVTAASTKGFTIGCIKTNGGLTFQWDGPIAEFIVYTRTLSTTEIAQVMNYLGSRY